MLLSGRTPLGEKLTHILRQVAPREVQTLDRVRQRVALPSSARVEERDYSTDVLSPHGVSNLQNFGNRNGRMTNVVKS